MFYKQYEKIYKKIAKDLNFNLKDDEKSSDTLNKLLQEKKLVSENYLQKYLSDKEVFVFGAGSSLENSIIKHKKKFKNKILISADGATSALLKNDLIPDIIVTDFDGNVIDQINANSKKSIVVIHGHGDNIDKIKKYLPKLKGKIIGTTQTNPGSYKNLYNFYGFTDGDRAVYLADYFKAKKINLIGFDYNGEIGKYSFSKNKDIRQKLKKLEWCKYLINLLKK